MPIASPGVPPSPTKSMTTSAPRPPVASRTASTWRPSAGMMRWAPRRPGQIECSGRGFHDHDFRRGHRSQQLNRDVADAARADDDGHRAAWQVRHGPLDGAVCSQPAIGQAGNLDRDRCAEFHECPGIGRHEVGEPAVEGRAHELEPLAELVMAPAARGAEAARALRVHEHWIPDLHVVDVRANGVNPAGSLMSQDGRKRFG